MNELEEFENNVWSLYLNFELKTIQNWASQGAIPIKKVGGSPRYLKSEIDEALKAGTLGSRPASTKAKRRKKNP